MTKVRRIIRPIGQGAFYTEQLKASSGTFNIVYDCGQSMSLEPPQKLKDEIDDYINEIGSDKLNIIFISHFHADHINGIKYLLKKAVASHPIIVMPLFNKKAMMLYFIENMIEYVRNEDRDNLLQRGETISFYQRLFFGKGENFKRIEGSGKAKPFNDLIKLPKDEWLYIPVVCIDNELKEYANTVFHRLVEAYPRISSKLKHGTVADIIDLEWDEIYNCIKGAKKNPKFKNTNLNNMSLILYSGVNKMSRVFENRWVDMYYDRCRGCHYCRVHNDEYILPGSLYTGDMEKAEAWDILQTKLFDKYPFAPYLSLFQISHHGHGYGKTASQDNTFNLNAPRFVNARLAFCCYGSQNRYHHPDYRLLKHYFEYNIPSIGIDEYTQPLVQIINS